MNYKNQIRDKITWLNHRTKEYDNGNPTVSDQEWDRVYFELSDLEKESGIIFPDSPTQNIPYEVKNELKKVEHSHKMLSLDKTKDANDIISFFKKNNTCLLMCKMDGLTCSLTYKNGLLVSAETRGNGLIGEDVLHNARVIKSIPKEIPYKEDLTIDGEIIITYKDFEKFSNNYKNPRNLASGSIRLLNSKECENRSLTFVVWDIINGFSDKIFLSEKLSEVKKLGFVIVPYLVINSIDLTLFDEYKNLLIKNATELSYPIDGLVFKINNIQEGQKLGNTEHHFKNAIAYKFYDDLYPSKLQNIEWKMGRTGIITPVAVFDTIDIDGTLINRASLHNISILKEILGDKPHKGQYIEVFKANMIIPQIKIADKTYNKLCNNILIIPSECPICHSPTVIKKENLSEVLLCSNPNCEGKLINILNHFCSKKGLDINGLSKAILEKLIAWEWVKNIYDLIELKQYRNEWIKKPGFGEKSVDKILNSIEQAKDTTLDKFISALSIPLIGNKAALQLTNHINSWEEFRQKINDNFDFSVYEDFGINKSLSLLNFNYSEADKIYPLLNINSNNNNNNNSNINLKDINIVITGKLLKFKNRSELSKLIQERGGKVTDSISHKTSYLINNDINSDSSKNKMAKRYNIPIISEEEFIKKFL